MLRSQTSTVQVRSMESRKPPIRVCTVGKVYRPDAVDATHMWMHHQLEGLWVESCRPVTMADLRTILRALQRGYLGPDTEVRLRPSYYPFVAPESRSTPCGMGDGWRSAVRAWSIPTSYGTSASIPRRSAGVHAGWG